MLRLPSLPSLAVGAVCLITAYGSEASADPAFIYDAESGVLQLNADLDPGTTLVSWLIQGPEALGILAFEDGSTSEGSDWVQGYFSGSEQWIAITGDGITGQWDVAQYETSLDLSDFGQVEYGLRFDSGGGSTGYTTVTAPVALDGDLNSDGFVGVDDLNIVLVNWNQNVTPGDKSAGDPTGEGFVGVDDLNIVLVNWNNGTPPEALAVPEPSLGLFVLTPLILARRNTLG